MSTRRHFLKTATGIGISSCAMSPLACTPSSNVAADEPHVRSDVVQLDKNLEPIVRLIERTPRDKCFEVIGDALQRGLPYRQFVAALFLAGIRNVNPQPPGFKFHCVFVIHAAHQMSLDLPSSQRLLPLFWALDNFKASQQRDIEEGDFQLSPVRGKLPSFATALGEFDEAMETWDEERADRAIVALARGASSHQLMERLWQYGARDYRNIGHKAIFVANTWRTLQTIGWQHAEPVLRSLVLGLLDFGRDKRVNHYAFTDQSFLANLELTRQNDVSLGQGVPIDSTSHFSEDLLDVMRSGNSPDATQMAYRALQTNSVHASLVWDAIHLAAAELMMRQPGIFGIHTVTSASALRYAYETAFDPKTRLLTLLQGIGWMCQFRNFMETKPDGLRSLRITDVFAASDSSSQTSTVNDIYACVGQDQQAAAAHAFNHAQKTTSPTDFWRQARDLIVRKGTDAHDYKYAISMFEDCRRVNQRWHPHMLAVATYHLRGTAHADSPLMQRAAEVVSSL